MSLDPTQQPTISVQAIVLAKAHYEIKGTVSGNELNGEYKTEYSLGYNFDPDGALQTRLGVVFTNIKYPDAIEVDFAVIGKFISPNKEELERFAPSSGMTLAPYLRSYVSTVTGWGPMNPIMLKLLNLTGPAVAQWKQLAPSPQPKKKGVGIKKTDKSSRAVKARS